MNRGPGFNKVKPEYPGFRSWRTNDHGTQPSRNWLQWLLVLAQRKQGVYPIKYMRMVLLCVLLLWLYDFRSILYVFTDIPTVAYTYIYDDIYIYIYYIYIFKVASLCQRVQSYCYPGRVKPTTSKDGNCKITGMITTKHNIAWTMCIIFRMYRMYFINTVSSFVTNYLCGVRCRGLTIC